MNWPLERIDRTKRYIKGNVALITHRLNTSHFQWSLAEVYPLNVLLPISEPNFFGLEFENQDGKGIWGTHGP